MMGALDNLVKGAAGQAEKQNMNLMFGLKENGAFDSTIVSIKYVIVKYCITK